MLSKVADPFAFMNAWLPTTCPIGIRGCMTDTVSSHSLAENFDILEPRYTTTETESASIRVISYDPTVLRQL